MCIMPDFSDFSIAFPLDGKPIILIFTPLTKKTPQKSLIVLDNFSMCQDIFCCVFLLHPI